MKKTKLILSMLSLGVIGMTTPLVMTSCSNEETPCETYKEYGKVVNEKKLFDEVPVNSYWQLPMINDNLLKIGDNPIEGSGWKNFIDFLNKDKPEIFEIFVEKGNKNFIEPIQIPYIQLYTK